VKVIKQTEVFTVIDDFLPIDQFDLMLEYAARCDFARNPRWIKPWDLSEEMPWQTGETVYTRGKAMHRDDPRKSYPTGMAIDHLFKAILDSEFYRQRVPNTYVTARTYLHPQNSGLDWHDDGARFDGAYSYYVHPRWHASWGGELMVIEDDIGRAPLPEKQHMQGGKIETVREQWNVLHKEDLSAILLERATATEFLFPKPNRIVFLRRGVWHKVNPVKSNAPFARCAVAGFFLGDQDQSNFWRA
jgi:hypothetical protein